MQVASFSGPPKRPREDGSPAPPYASVVSQRLHRIDARSAPGGNQRGPDSDSREYERRHREAQKVEATDAIEPGGSERRGPRRKAQSEQGSCERDDQRVSKHQALD